MATAKSRCRQNRDFDTIFDSADPIPVSVVSSDSVEMVKQNQVALTTTPQMVTLDNLVKMQVTNRGSSIVSLSTFGNEDGVAQVETNTIASAVLLGGDLDVTVTAAGMTGTPATITATVLGTFQQETITIDGAPTSDGDITVTVTAAGMTGGSKALTVAVLDVDTVDEVASKIKVAMILDTVSIGDFFTVSGTGADVEITSRVAIADDATMDIVGAAGTTGTSFTASADTTTGVAASTAAEIAEIVKDALNADAVICAMFTATRSGDDVILTDDTAGANDTTMNLGVATGTATGLTASPKSVNTTAGYAAGDWDQIGGQGTLTLEPPTNTTNSSPFTFVWIKATASVTAIIRGWKEA